MSATVTEVPSNEMNVEAEEIQNCKHKKRRRGKKRKYKTQDSVTGDTAKDEIPESHVISSSKCKKRHKKVLIRPVDAPKAPWNSTQFIMDDHDECHLYFSFETPNPYHYDDESSDKKCDDPGNLAEIEDAAYQDIDYVYHSMEDFDNSAYYQQDFEVSYTNMRYEELLRLQKPDLISTLENLDIHLKELEDKLIEEDPSTALEQLQQKLLTLQEENALLRASNEGLKNIMKGDPEEDSHSDHSHISNLPDEHSLSEASHSESDQSGDDSEDSCDEMEISFGSSHTTSDCLHESQDGSLYINGGSDFIHVAIEPSSADSYASGEEVTDDVVHNKVEKANDSFNENVKVSNDSVDSVPDTQTVNSENMLPVTESVDTVAGVEKKL